MELRAFRACVVAWLVFAQAEGRVDRSEWFFHERLPNVDENVVIEVKANGLARRHDGARLLEAMQQRRRGLDAVDHFAGSTGLETWLDDFKGRDHRLTALGHSGSLGGWLGFVTGSEGVENGSDEYIVTSSKATLENFVSTQNSAGRAITSLAFGGNDEWVAWANSGVNSTGERHFDGIGVLDFLGLANDNIQNHGCFPTLFTDASAEIVGAPEFYGVCRHKPSNWGSFDWRLAYTVSTGNLLAYLQERISEGFEMEAVAFSRGSWAVYVEKPPSGLSVDTLLVYSNNSTSVLVDYIESRRSQFGQISAITADNGYFLFSMHPEINITERLPPTPAPSPSATPMPTTPSPIPSNPSSTNYVDVEFITSAEGYVQEAFERARTIINNIIVTEAFEFALGTQISNLQGACQVDYPLEDSFMTRGLFIVAQVGEIDGLGAVLGQAGPCLTVTGSSFPLPRAIVGVMQFDEADLEMLNQQGSLDRVILHEMLHCVGIGTLWSSFLTGTSTDPRFNGENGVAGFKELGGLESTIPVANTGGPGTALGHWRESTFQNELMTGYASGSNALSIMTAKSLEDLGFTIDLAYVTDDYQIPGISEFDPDDVPPPPFGDDTNGGGTTNLNDNTGGLSTSLIAVIAVGSAAVMISFGAVLFMRIYSSNETAFHIERYLNRDNDVPEAAPVSTLDAFNDAREPSPSI